MNGIRELRKQLGVTQVEFAKTIGVEPLTVIRMEREGLPASYQRAHVIMELCQSVGMDYEAIFKGG